MITPQNKTKILRILNVFETGTPGGKYDMVVVYADGKNGSRQVTYGRSQTTEQGNLPLLIKKYIQKNGIYKNEFTAYLPKIGVQPLCDDVAFKTLLKKAAREDVLMREAQDEFFDFAYYNPALKFFDTNKFTFPLSLLVIYDSYIHSGGVPAHLRKLFGEFPPSKGGDEKKWVAAYSDVRHQWLKYHNNPIVRKTIYRTQCFKEQIAAGNWNLELPVNANGTIINSIT